MWVVITFFTLVHPDKILHISEINKLLPLEPVYPCTKGISSAFLISILQRVLLDLPNQKEWNDSGMIAKNNWPSWQNAVKNLHFPKSIHDFYLARKRLAFDEMIAMYLVMQKAQSDGILSEKQCIKSSNNLFMSLALLM